MTGCRDRFRKQNWLLYLEIMFFFFFFFLFSLNTGFSVG